MKRFGITLGCTLSLACATSAESPPVDSHRISVTASDFFLYTCVTAYVEANSIQSFDGSTGYGVENSTLTGAELAQIDDAARAFARTLPEPDYSDPDHGLPPVLALCQRAAAGR